MYCVIMAFKELQACLFQSLNLLPDLFPVFSSASETQKVGSASGWVSWHRQTKQESAVDKNPPHH